MTDSDIKKTLECCITNKCDECAIYKKCHNENGKGRVQAVLDLINQQQAEIEKLNVELVGMRGACESYKMHYDKAQAEVERLKALVDEMSVYFPTCIGCEGKTTLGERTDKSVYLVDDTEYCAKRGISNIANIMKENEALKTEIELLRKAKAEDVSRAYKIAKSEAIKEFAERLKEKGAPVTGGKGFEGVFVMCSNLVIDNLVKEMTEGNQ